MKWRRRWKIERNSLPGSRIFGIAHIHGFEDSTDVKALVMELVEGPTLADRIAKSPIPLNDILPIAKQIAEALEAAHNRRRRRPRLRVQEHRAQSSKVQRLVPGHRRHV